MPEKPEDKTIDRVDPSPLPTSESVDPSAIFSVGPAAFSAADQAAASSPNTSAEAAPHVSETKACEHPR